MRSAAKLHVAHPRINEPSQPKIQLQGSLQRWFLPHKETRLMADEVQRTGGVFLPYPLLGFIMTLVLVLGGGIISMYVKVDTMSSAIIMRDADHREALQKLEKSLELQQMYINDDRKQLAGQQKDLEYLLRQRRGGN